MNFLFDWPRLLGFAAVGTLLIAWTACRPAPRNLESAKASLMAVDREFNEAVKEGGATGWASFFADKGRMLPHGAPPVIGREAVLQAMEPFFSNSGNSLNWEPEVAEVAASGDLGYTIGSYVSRSRGAGGEMSESEGKYVTIWKKQPDGSWKVVVDIGNPNGR